MAKRLIDANALNWGRCPTDAKLAKAWLYEAPTVDAVEVVRCKDCDFAYEGSYGLVCAAWGARTDYDMFCGNGERREGNG